MSRIVQDLDPAHDSYHTELKRLLTLLAAHRRELERVAATAGSVPGETAEAQIVLAAQERVRARRSGTM